MVRGVNCYECGDPIVYSGRGRRPYYCPDCRKRKRRANIEAWRLRNPDSVRRYEEKHRSDLFVRFRRRLQARGWRRRHPETGLERRKARAAAPGPGWTDSQWLALKLHYAPGGRCLACERRGPLQADHVMPIAMGGRNEIANIQPLCRQCNRNKGTYWIEYRPDEGEFARKMQEEDNVPM